MSATETIYKISSINMRKNLRRHLYVILGWLFIALGVVGTVIPVLPTTPFLIVALALFSKSSPRFHHMLLNNSWFGPTLQEWQDKKTLARQTKYRASFLIILAFTISVAVLREYVQLQMVLVVIALFLLYFIWRIKE